MWWQLPPGPQRAAAKAAAVAELEARPEHQPPTKQARRIERAKIDGRNVIVAGDLVYTYDNAEGERLARSMARFGILPLPAGVNVQKDGDTIYLTDGRNRVPVDITGSPRVLTIVTNYFRPTPEKDN